MTATDLAAVILAFVALGVTAMAVVAIMMLRRSADEVRELAVDLRTHADSTMAQIESRATTMDDDLRRVDGLIASAERVSARADTLSKVTYGAVAKPVIKTAALVNPTNEPADKTSRRRSKGRTARTQSANKCTSSPEQSPTIALASEFRPDQEGSQDVQESDLVGCWV
jgi:hypothetical protein